MNLDGDHAGTAEDLDFWRRRGAGNFSAGEPSQVRTEVGDTGSSRWEKVRVPFPAVLKKHEGSERRAQASEAGLLEPGFQFAQQSAPRRGASGRTLARDKTGHGSIEGPLCPEEHLAERLPVQGLLETMPCEHVVIGRRRPCPFPSQAKKLDPEQRLERNSCLKQKKGAPKSINACRVGTCTTNTAEI